MKKEKRPQEEPGYSAHRERQRRRILSAAEDLFVRLGVDRVSMLEITEACRIQPSTLYQYFKRKEDIVWAITAEVLSDIHQRVTTRLAEQMTAFQRVEALLDLMGEELELRAGKVRFMAQFDVLYARDLSTESLLQLERQLGIGPVSELGQWMTAGIEDGSIHPTLKSDTALLAILNAAIGTQRRLACLGSKVELEYGQPAVILFREAMQILLSGLRPPATTASQLRRKTVRTTSKKTIGRSK